MVKRTGFWARSGFLNKELGKIHHLADSFLKGNVDNSACIFRWFVIIKRKKMYVKYQSAGHIGSAQYLIKAIFIINYSS